MQLRTSFTNAGDSRVLGGTPRGRDAEGLKTPSTISMKLRKPSK